MSCHLSRISYALFTKCVTPTVTQCTSQFRRDKLWHLRKFFWIFKNFRHVALLHLTHVATHPHAHWHEVGIGTPNWVPLCKPLVVPVWGLVMTDALVCSWLVPQTVTICFKWRPHCSNFRGCMPAVPRTADFLKFFLNFNFCIYLFVEQLVSSSSESSLSAVGRGFAAWCIHSQATHWRRSEPLRQPWDVLQYQISDREYTLIFLILCYLVID